MKIRNLLFAAIATITVGCGADKASNQGSQSVQVPGVSQEEIAARNALVKETPQTALIKVPLDANGEPDFTKAEVRTSMQALNVSSENELISAFNSAPAADNVSVITNDSLDADTSSNSWALLPWRNRIENGVAVRDGPYLLPWRRQIARAHNDAIFGCGPRCLPPPPPPCGPRCLPPPPPPCARPACQTTVVTTTVRTCTTCGGGFNVNAVPYYSHGGYQWDYQAQPGFVSGGSYYYSAQNAYGVFAANQNWL